jgi:hypothetical protein
MFVSVPALTRGISASTAGIIGRKTAMSLLGACTMMTASKRSGNFAVFKIAIYRKEDVKLACRTAQ